MRKNYIYALPLILLSLHLNAQVWTTVSTPYPSVEQLAVANNTLFIATATGMYASADGSAWNLSSTGMTPLYGSVYGLTTVYNFNNVLYAGAQGKLYKSVDYGANWTELTGAAPTAAAFNVSVYVKGDTIIAGWKSNDKITKSTDGGTTWSSVTLYEGVSKNIVELNGAFYIRNYMGVSKSTDWCATFSTLTGVPSSMLDGALIASNHVLICGLNDSALYISNDQGSTWSQTSTNYEPYYFEIINAVLYQGTNDRKVFKSTDNGTTWTDLTGTGINSDKVHSFAIFDGYLYASATNVLYRTNISTSISENLLTSNTIAVYPVPASDYITIDNTEKGFNGRIQIYHITGQLAAEFFIYEEKHHTIDISDLSGGIYFIEVIQNGIVTRQKFIKE